MTDFLEGIRADMCTKGPDGQWLCSECGASPLGSATLLCDDCQARAELKRRQLEKEHRRQEWTSDVHRMADRAIAALPAWAHLRGAEEFAAAVSSKALRSVAERWRPTRGSLLLLGSSGVGKTSCAARAVVRLRDERLAARLESPRDDQARTALIELSRLKWVTAAELARAWNQHRLGSGHEPELIRGAAEAPILIIDELGPEPTRLTGDIFDLIDRRHTVQRPTICTSGLTEAAFRERYGDAFMRRLTERGIGLLVDTHPQAPQRGAGG